MDHSGDRLVNDEEASEHLRLAPGTLRQWRYRGRGPAFVRVGGKVRYRRGDLDAWVERNRVDPASSR